MLRKSINACRVLILLLVAFLSTATLGQGIDKNHIWETQQNAIVQIHASGTGSDASPKPMDVGTGVMVSADGFILTALHVVGADEDWMRVGPDKQLDRHVEVKALDAHGVARVLSANASVKALPDADLAILRVDGHCFPYARLASGRPTGFPTLVAILWGSGTTPKPVSTDLTLNDIAKYGDKLTVENLAAVGGYSGSPLFNAAGEVVGIVTNQLGATGALATPSTEAISSIPPRDPAMGTGVYPTSCYSACRHPDNGVDRWANEEKWNVDSGWRGGGYDPTSFCLSVKAKREQAHPGRVVTYQTQPEEHKSEYDPFKRDYYKYYCSGIDRWDPVYAEARSPSCGLISR